MASRANPIEYGIFAIVTLLFGHSLYSLLYTHDDFRFAALTPMAASPISESRAPASVVPAFVSVELKCDGTSEQSTRAAKLRLSGPLCADKASVVRTVVVNDTNRFTATVFTDMDQNQFSTDYIPLNTGRNLIQVESGLKSGKSLSQSVIVVRE